MAVSRMLKSKNPGPEDPALVHTEGGMKVATNTSSIQVSAKPQANKRPIQSEKKL